MKASCGCRERGLLGVDGWRCPDTVKAVDNPTPYELKLLTTGSAQIAVNYYRNRGQALIRWRTSITTAPSLMADKVLKCGHERNSIYNVKNGIFTRGVLIEIPRLKGVPSLEPGALIYAEELEAWDKRVGVKVGAGVALFVAVLSASRKAVEP